MTVPSAARAERGLVLLGLGLALAAAVLAVQAAGRPPTKGLSDAPPWPDVAALFAGAFLVAGTVRTAMTGWRASRWPTATGEVVAASRDLFPYLYVAVRFTVGDRPVRADTLQVRLAPGVPPQLTPGARVGLRYSEADPTAAILEPRRGRGALALLAVGVVLVVGAGAGAVGP